MFLAFWKPQQRWITHKNPSLFLATDISQPQTVGKTQNPSGRGDCETFLVFLISADLEQRPLGPCEFF